MLDIWNKHKRFKKSLSGGVDEVERWRSVYRVNSCKEQLRDVAVDSHHGQPRLRQEVGKMAALGVSCCLFQALVNMAFRWKAQWDGTVNVPKGKLVLEQSFKGSREINKSHSGIFKVSADHSYKDWCAQKHIQWTRKYGKEQFAIRVY